MSGVQVSFKIILNLCTVWPGVQTKKSPAFWQKSPNLSPQYINKIFKPQNVYIKAFMNWRFLAKKLSPKSSKNRQNGDKLPYLVTLSVHYSNGYNNFCLLFSSTVNNVYLASGFGNMRKSRMSKPRMRKYRAKKTEWENLEFQDFLILPFSIKL